MKHVAVCHSSVHGGAEAYLTRLYSLLAEKGHQSLLIGSMPTWNEAGLRSVNPNLSEKWGGSTIISGLKKLRREKQRVARITEQELPVGLFHLQFKREQVGFTALLAKRAPVVWTEHGRFLKGVKGWLLAYGYRLAAKKTAAIICVSKEVAGDVRSIVGSKPRIVVIANSVDTATLRPATPDQRQSARAALGLSAAEPVALWIGRLHKEKKPELAARLAMSERWTGTVLVAGEGSERATIEELGKSLPNLRILGHVVDTSVLYHAADVVLFTSTGASEGYPTTTMVESAAFGLPTVTNEGSGAAAYVVAAGGRVVADAASGDDWANAVLGLNNPEAKSAARSWGQEHDVRNWLDAHLEVFRAVR